jgi:hypothetical protein
VFDIFYIHNPPHGRLASIAKQVETIADARSAAKTRYCWVVDGFNNYDDFDFLWEPKPWEANRDHVWPSQHQQHGGTMLLTKDWGGDTNYNHPVVPRVTAPNIIYLDIGNSESDEQYDILQKQFNIVKTRFIADYHGTLKRVISKIEEPYVWVIGSVCDYEEFDFTWHPSEWQRDMLHVFPSSEQKFGDTFYIPVQKFKENPGELLEWFDTICFQDQTVPRFAPPIVYKSKTDTIAELAKSAKFNGPIGVLTTDPTLQMYPEVVPAINLWRKETRTIVPITKSHSIAVFPRDALADVKHEVYDYPYIDKSLENKYGEPPLDVVFLSNGETNAEENLAYLKEHLPEKMTLHEVSGINGRVAAYQACAEAANTDWLFIVWGKLKINKHFDWSWQPDRFQQAKHYIFYARNPVTNLVYGHMGMAAYNKRLTLKNDGSGLDFIMSQPHEVVPLLSGTAEYAHNPWMAWRTSFREVLKLKSFEKTDAKAATRLNSWMTVGDGEFGQWSLLGAKDGIDYYKSVNGNFESLKLSYEWAWLRERFDKLYPG